MRDSGADAYLTDAGPAAVPGLAGLHVSPGPALQALGLTRRRSHDTEWILLNSGTSGAAKLVQHTLARLTRPYNDQEPPPRRAVCATFHDIRRYGVQQIFLRPLHHGWL